MGRSRLMTHRSASSTALFCLLASPLLLSPGLVAQDSGGSGGSGSSSRSVPTLDATRVTDAPPQIDGILDEAIWDAAPVATNFVQREPNEGAPASERTEARVLYGADALYVAIRAYDRDPDAIVSQLARRDQDVFSDWVFVAIDSYFDRRTAFRFGVNPDGVRQDVYHFDDTNEDRSWDAVWDSAVRRDAEGWTAEFEIPYSQLRFDADQSTWGIQFARVIARHDETSLWAPVRSRDGALVSLFGELRGMNGIETARRLEVLPYSVARLTRGQGDPANPFFNKNDGFGTVGADVKYGITDNITLDMTINPDFGQVEADPGQVNLSAFETFLQERRPFFVEGSGIFRYGLSQGDGDDANEQLFYSRRIGRAPQGSADAQGGYLDSDAQTNIAGAWKVSGKTSSGVSVGFMHAVTVEERADIVTGGGLEETAAIEPLTNYAMARLIKDFRDGRSAVGFVATAVNRDKEISDGLGLRSGGYTGGIDLRHRFFNDEWSVDLFLVGSHVRGSAESILDTQRSSARFFQRPDADHVEVDPNRTSLTGWSSNFSVGKFRGGFWRVATGFQARSPEFEANDMGFMRNADLFSNWFWTGYHKSVPGEHLQAWNVNVNAWHGWTFGGEHTGAGGNIGGWAQLKNFWSGYGGIGRNVNSASTAALRGGPLLKTEDNWFGWSGINSDSRTAIQGGLNTWWGVRPESDSWNWGLSPRVSARAGGSFRASLGPFYSRNVDDRQWVTGQTLDDTQHYVLGRLNQTTMGITTRFDYSFSPTVSLQFYAQPFVAAAEYSDFKTLRDAKAERYADRFQALNPSREDPSDPTSDYLFDLNNDGTLESISNPDFNVKQFRSNVVLRWEYRPGSALFLVWSQGRDAFLGGQGDFEFGRDFQNVFADTQPENIFLIKFNYWLSP